MTRSTRWIVAAIALLALQTVAAPAANAAPDVCGDPDNPTVPQTLPAQDWTMPPTSPSPELVVKGLCQVKASTSPYYFSAVNIIANGHLEFIDPGSSAAVKTTDFWASSIIVENQGALTAGEEGQPYGAAAANIAGALLRITLYGKDETSRNPAANTSQGALCVTKVKDPKPPAGSPNPFVPCGVPTDAWDSNGDGQFTLPGNDAAGNPIKDYFYTYGPMYGDGKQTLDGQIGYFGNKVLGVSYGGTLSLFGYKGATDAKTADPIATQTGTSWVRLAADLAADQNTMTLSTSVAGDWKKDDWIVITTTDYLPTHTEKVQISEDPTTTDPSGMKVKFSPAVTWPHRGTTFSLSRLDTGPGNRLTQAHMDETLISAGAETRAAVGLLTRSIQIVSGGDTAGQTFDQAETASGKQHYYYGGHTVFRQGLQKVQIQGVEFRQLGQGGVLGHYPVHFHMARLVPTEPTVPLQKGDPDNSTFVKDSSINESMTRWIVIHSTLGVRVARNVGFESIGHGFYLEDGTETNNKFYSNLGVSARAAVAGPENPHNVPGILAESSDGVNIAKFPQQSDIINPAAFWIMNGWNEFIGNMAAGTGSCGSCYWLVPGANSDMKEVSTTPMTPMTWTGVTAINGNSAIQANGRDGTSSLKAFYKNYCSTSMNAFMTVGATSCGGVTGDKAPTTIPDFAQYLHAITSPPLDATLYPQAADKRNPTICDPNVKTGPTSCAQFTEDASKLTECDNQEPSTCALTLLDHFTTSFNWPQTNFSAVWLRSGWNMLDNSFISDIQNGGVTLVSGGDFTRSSVAEGYWGLMSRSILVGRTQPLNSFAYSRGPFNTDSQKLDPTYKCTFLGPACSNVALGVVYPMTNWMAQRLFSIYDGPSYQDSNAFLDVASDPCASFSDCMYWNNAGVRANATPSILHPAEYLANAAIAWKQPNGFYYPPAFHSTNLFFSDVQIRHFLIEPLFIPSTYRTNLLAVGPNYAGVSKGNPGLFNGYTDIDRQTELNDDDGTLTGLSKTISVSEDTLFSAPVETSECLSNIGITPGNVCANTKPTAPSARTSPYDYVTTVLYPDCASSAPPGPPDNGQKPPPPSYFDQACGSKVADVRNPDHGNQLLEAIGRGGTWSKDCAGPFCFGVPIYRQLLNGKSGAMPTMEWVQWQMNGCNTNPDPSTKPYVDAPANATGTDVGDAKCQFPFARMNAAATFARSALTANYGVYYIDTTIGQQVQKDSIFASTGMPDKGASDYIDCSQLPVGYKASSCQPLSVNAFEDGQTYYAFLLFAKKTTQQIYQIYVGPDFNPAKDFKQVIMDVSTAQVVPSKLPNKDPVYATATMIQGPGDADGKPGVLQVTLNFASLADVLNPKLEQAGLCRPTGFCGWTGKDTCGCVLDKNDPRVKANPNLPAICASVCTAPAPPPALQSGGWATKDLDCPPDGCRGFSFTMHGYKPGTYDRPTVVPYTKSVLEPLAWQIPFQKVTVPPDNADKGACFYEHLPGSAECPSGN